MIPRSKYNSLENIPKNFTKKVWRRNSLKKDLVDLRNSSTEKSSVIRWFDYQLA